MASIPEGTTSVPALQRKVLRVVETYGRTFVAAFVAQLVLSGFDVTTISDLSQAKKVGVSALAAGIQAVLSTFGLTLGKGGTVSLLPRRYDPATPPVSPPSTDSGYDAAPGS